MGGFLSNLGGDLASVLSSPTVQEALPAVAEGLGGALTAPKHEPRAAIGRALIGGAQGYEQGQRNVIEQQQLKAQQLYQQTMIQHLALQDKIAAGKIPAEQVEAQQAKAFGALPDQVKAQYGYDPKQWAHAQSTIAIQGANVPSKQAAVAAMLQTTSGKQYLASYGINTPQDIPTDPTYLNKILANRGNAAKMQSDLAKNQAEIAASQAHTAEAGAHIQEAEAGTQEKEMEMAGTLPPRPESPDVKAEHEATTKYLTDTLPAREDKASGEAAATSAKTVNDIVSTYTKENPVPSGLNPLNPKGAWRAGLDKRLAGAGFDPSTRQPMAPQGKASKTPDGVYQDKTTGKYHLVKAGIIYGGN